MQTTTGLETGAIKHPTAGVEVLPVSPVIGAEVRGVDLSAPMEPPLFEAIHKAWLKHLVLIFRDQELDGADLVRFSRRFGDLDVAPLDKNGRMFVEGVRELLIISNVVQDGRPLGALGNAESAWHTDMSYNDEPPMASSLYAVSVPPSGGDTGFLNMYVAYETLPPDLRQRVEGLQIKHDSTHDSVGERRRGLPEITDISTSPGAVHPMVRTHPETGRKALFLGRRRYAYVLGLPVPESERLLDELWTHCVQERFYWHHQWRRGDLVLWDNRCIMHRRDAFDPEARRIMHRTQIKGDRPF